jgi:Domain of unknown function (DUF1824)
MRLIIRNAIVVQLTLNSSAAFSIKKSRGPVIRLHSSPLQQGETSEFSVASIQGASEILQTWDTFSNSDISGDNDVSHEKSILLDAVRLLNAAASQERAQDSTTGRCMLGICASSIQEGVGALKSWVTSLQLPRGLLHGMDQDGAPLDIDGGVYIKYNSGGVYTFADIRKSGTGFESLWKPGDAMLEPYDGSFRGVYFQVELSDGEFRQYLLPLDTFHFES